MAKTFFRRSAQGTRKHRGDPGPLPRFGFPSLDDDTGAAGQAVGSGSAAGGGTIRLRTFELGAKTPWYLTA